MAYPNEERFNAENFGNTPLLEIEAALKAIEERDEEVAYQHTLPVALAGQAMCNLQGVNEVTLGRFSPIEQRRERERIQRVLPKPVAETLIELAKESRLPGWITEAIDFELVQKAAE